MKKNERHSLLVAIFVFFGVVASVIFVCKSTNHDETVNELSVNTSTEAELNLTYHSTIDSIQKSLEKGEYPIKEIQGLYSRINTEIGRVYTGRILKRQDSPVYENKIFDKYSFSFVDSKTGNPTWGFIMPTVMTKMKKIENWQKGSSSQTVENFVAIQIVHEMSKLVFLENVPERTLENECVIESFVWCDICEEIIQPLFEKQGVVFDDEIFNMYFGWIMTGGVAVDDWRDFVRKQFIPEQK